MSPAALAKASRTRTSSAVASSATLSRFASASVNSPDFFA